MDCQISNLPICFAACYKPKPEQYSTLYLYPVLRLGRNKLKIFKQCLWVLLIQINSSDILEKTAIRQLLLFQISITSVSDIYQLQIRYQKKQQPLGVMDIW